jgi:hypothetical protein
MAWLLAEMAEMADLPAAQLGLLTWHQELLPMALAAGNWRKKPRGWVLVLVSD